MTRNLLAGLIVVATVAFVIGTIAERRAARHERSGSVPATAAPMTTHVETTHAETTATSSATSSETGGESAPSSVESSAAKPAGGETAAEAIAHGETPGTQNAELRPLGVDIEAWPFVALAALSSLAFALGVVMRPGDQRLLIVVALAMLAFAALDVREIFHQHDESRTGLALLAGFVAALHLAAALAALALTRRGQRDAAAVLPA